MSDKSIAERLQVKNDRYLAVIGAPIEVDAAIGETQRRVEPHSADVVLSFVRDRVSLEAELAGALPRLKPAAIFWLAYPRLSSKLASDLNRDVIRAAVPAHGLDTVSQIAIDDDWSALRLKRLG